MNYQEKADQYAALLKIEKDIKSDLEDITKQRKELMTEISEGMDADGISQIFGSDGQRVSAVHTVYGNVEDFPVFKRYVTEHGLQDNFLKEVVIKKAINDVARQAKTAATGLLEQVAVLMPPGLGVRYDTHLRVTTPKNSDAGFKDAAKSLLEVIGDGESEGAENLKMFGNGNR